MTVGRWPMTVVAVFVGRSSIREGIFRPTIPVRETTPYTCSRLPAPNENDAGYGCLPQNIF